MKIVLPGAAGKAASRIQSELVSRRRKVLSVARDVLMDAVRQTGTRLVVVGAASLEVVPGVTLLDSGHLPPEWKPIATSHAHLLALLKNSDIDWTYFS